MRIFYVVAFAFLLMFACTPTVGEPLDPRGYAWRGYANICIQSEVLGSGCDELQTTEAFASREECEERVPQILNELSDAVLARDPDAGVRAQWLCDEDRDTYNA